MVYNLEKVVAEGEFSDTARASLTRYVVDTYTALFSQGIQTAMARCTTRDDVICFQAKLEQIYRHVIQPTLEGRTEDISGRLPKEPIVDTRSYQVTYNGPYPTFGHALFDFRVQTDLAADKIARRVYLSTRTIWQLENNQQPTKAKSITYYRKNEMRIKKRFFSLFKVSSEHEKDVMALLLFAPGIASARDEYGTKRENKRRVGKTKE